jgi:NitT/TauT family transport system substrate-binding protein
MRCHAAYLGIAVLAAATACGSSSTASTGNPSDITVAAIPIVANAPVWIAQEQGLFAREGLHVTIKPVVQTTAATADMVHGSVQIISGANFVSFFQAQDTGVLSLKIVAEESVCVPQANQVIVPPGSPVIGPRQLKDATIAVNVLSNVQTLTTDEVLAADGVPTDHIHYVVVPFPDMATALAAHRVDAANEVEPFLSQAEVRYGDVPVLDACQGPTLNLPLSGSVALSGWVAAHQQEAREFQDAMQQAATLGDENRSLVEQAAEQHMGVSPQIAAVMTVGRFPTDVDGTQIARMAQQMLAAGLISRPLNVSSMVFR